MKWLDVPGWEGYYQVSDHGDVRRDGHLLKAADSQGHMIVCLTRPGQRWTVTVHRLVLLAFRGPLPPGLERLHRNGDHTDNRLSNLRYGTSSENKLDTVAHGTHHYAKRSHCSKGHEFTPENTRMRKSGSGRVCRACQATAKAEYQARQIPTA